METLHENTAMAFHRKSEECASQAEIHYKEGCVLKAQEAYKKAAILEEKCLALLDHKKVKTVVIIITSAASLWCKAGNPSKAKGIIENELARAYLPQDATAALRGVLKEILDGPN